MLRTALKPHWLALLVVVLLAATAMSWLGQWQLDRARERSVAAERARVPRDPVELSSVLRARETFTGADADELVVATGRWDPERQVLVTPRNLEGVTGMWVVTPLRLADGSGVAVVRGWVTGPDDPGAAPPADGEVRITGRLRPSEPPAEHEPGEGSGLPAGQVERIAVPLLIQQWPYPLLTGYIVQTGVTPAPATPPRPVPAVPDGGGLALLNVSYALQWWLFAGCGLFLWWRLVRDDYLGRPILQRPDDNRDGHRHDGSGTDPDDGPDNRDVGPYSRDDGADNRDDGADNRDDGADNRDDGPGSHDDGPGNDHTRRLGDDRAGRLGDDRNAGPGDPGHGPGPLVGEDEARMSSTLGRG